MSMSSSNPPIYQHQVMLPVVVLVVVGANNVHSQREFPCRHLLVFVLQFNYLLLYVIEFQWLLIDSYVSVGKPSETT